MAVTTRDINIRFTSDPPLRRPVRDEDAPTAPQPITLRDIEALPEEYREAAMKRWVAQQAARDAQFVPDPVPPPRGDLLPSLTAEPVAAGDRFAAAVKAASKPHPAPGLHLTWEQLDSLHKDDPDGSEAWSRATRVLNLRFR